MAGLRYKAKKRGGKQLRLVEYTEEMEPHWCDKGHIGYVLDGRFEIKYEREIAVYNPGDGIFIPAGEEHRHMGKVLSGVVRVVFVEDA
jgi:quercetin dioxygenase-like cupin family protein